MRKLLFILALTFMPFAASAAETAPPACNAENVGLLHCVAGKSCECKYFPKSAMAGTPERFGWDCGINRGPCIDQMNINAPTQNQTPVDIPPNVIIDKRP